jgi:hypothetical protein
MADATAVHLIGAPTLQIVRQGLDDRSRRVLVTEALEGSGHPKSCSIVQRFGRRLRWRAAGDTVPATLQMTRPCRQIIMDEVAGRSA